MLIYLPKIYPNELVFSWFSRMFLHSGLLSHKDALRELFCKRSDNPHKEFIGNLNENAKKVIEQVYPMRELIMHHTMFPQYARFIPLQQKIDAMHKLIHGHYDVHHLFCVLPRYGDEQFLRICPICFQEDKKKYGEGYFHMNHQIRQVDICHKHRCKLQVSDISAKTMNTFTFSPADIVVQPKEAIYIENPEKCNYVEYVTRVFEASMDMEKDVPLSAILYYGMQDTPYLKSTGKMRNSKMFYDDMKEYYEGMGMCNIASFYQVQRVLLGMRYDFSVACQIAFFLKIPVEMLVNSMLSKEQIEIEQQTHYVKNAGPKDWVMLDEETAPLLEQLAADIYSGGASEQGRPERVSEKLIYRELNLLSHRLEKMPKCQAIMKKYEESYPECWARRIIWAYNQLRCKEKIRWVDIRVLAGVKKENLGDIKPYLWKHANEEVVDKILAIAGETQESDK